MNDNNLFIILNNFNVKYVLEYGKNLNNLQDCWLKK